MIYGFRWQSVADDEGSADFRVMSHFWSGRRHGIKDSTIDSFKNRVLNPIQQNAKAYQSGVFN